MTRRKPSQYDWEKVLFDETFMTHSFTPQASKNVEAIVVHHAVIAGSDERALDAIWNVWQTSGTSAHYGVVGPYVRQYVRDKDYAWAVGNTHGNASTISIEHVNSALAPGYQVAESTWKTGAKLVAYLHKAYGLGRPVDGRTLRKHSSYSSTACPGPFLGGTVWAQYVREAQRVYDAIVGGKPVDQKPIPELDLGEDVKLIRDEKGGIYYIYEMGYYHIKDPAQVDAAVKLWGKPIQVSNGHRAYHIKAAEGRVNRLKAALGK